MLVYRIERIVSGEGIYATGLGWQCCRAAILGDEEADHASCHPAPPSDPGLSYWWYDAKEAAKTYHCGFESIEQMMMWFPHQGFAKMLELDRHPSNPLHVGVYDVDAPNLKIGQKQIMFHKLEARFIRSIPISEFVTPLQQAA